ncbi:ABC transporter permease [Brachybacterium sp. JHP9]|uniref:ABC transporter permease n=1 Tax=Brachybacterium equifaecis TaxID=2910770 RepID=A0ABT0QWY1_9MICO|nr:ABC transporter permease [Brachybacterium equifaecis]
MFVAWRDLRFARGRFALIATVVALIMLLVGFLAGLTGGLAHQNISAVLAMPGDRLVLAAPDGEKPDFAASDITAETQKAWTEADGVTGVLPIGVVQGRAEITAPAGAQSAGAPSAGAQSAGAAGVAVVGLPREDSAGRAPRSTALTALAPASDGEVGLSAGAAEELDAHVGDTLTIVGQDFTVASIGEDVWYSHTAVIALTPSAWASVDERFGGTGDPTVLAVTGEADWDALASSTSTSAASPLASLRALSTFTSEVGSLALMIGMLFGVSALVVGAFFTVWTMQRAGDVAVLKALGASTASLVRDALGQAAVVLAIGIGAGLLAVVGLGALAGTALPFLLSPLTTLVPALAMAVLGLAGAAFALRSVTSADPLTALGSTR